EAAPADAADAADPRVALAQRPHRRRGAIGRVVVDEDDLPVDAVEPALQPRDQQRNIGPLVEGGNHDGELGGRASRGARARRRLAFDQYPVHTPTHIPTEVSPLPG